jgi:hypothetical protein
MLEDTDHHTTSQCSTHQHSQHSNNPAIQNSPLQPYNPPARTLEPVLDSRTLPHSDSTPFQPSGAAPLSHASTPLQPYSKSNTHQDICVRNANTLERSAHPRNHTITPLNTNTTQHRHNENSTQHNTSQNTNTQDTTSNTGTQTLSPMLQHTTSNIQTQH